MQINYCITGFHSYVPTHTFAISPSQASMYKIASDRLPSFMFKMTRK